MNLKKLIRETWEDERVRELKIKIGEVRIILEVMLEKLEEGLINNKIIKIRDYFSIEVKTIKGRKTKIGDNEVEYDDFEKIVIRPSKRMKNNINKK